MKRLRVSKLIKAALIVTILIGIGAFVSDYIQENEKVQTYIKDPFIWDTNYDWRVWRHSPM